MKNIEEKILMAEEKIKQLKNKRKKLISKQKQEERKKRDRRIYERGAVFESIFTESKNLEMAITKQEKSIQQIGMSKAKQKSGEKHGQTLQTNIFRKTAYRKKWITVLIKDKE
ncbi:hypothetical protein HMPREF9126_1578 [Parvimonas sp. oral taxon 110 str. F0139]|nr:hypothetical protein HMPREF9126_1578 [Parvimonas sp. oral taxon 110 str. F0139]